MGRKRDGVLAMSSLGRENSSTIEAWQGEFIPPAVCKHCKQNDKELHEYDGLTGLWCEDCADIHINNEQEMVSMCCGAGRFEYIEDMCSSCHEMADFECMGCGE